MSKKKLLYVVEAMGGGVFTYIVDFANELVKQFELYIAYAVRPQTPADFKEYFDDRIHLIEVKNFCREIQPLKDFAAIREVKKIAAEIEPDIIHLHSSKAGVIGRIAFWKSNIPLFYTPHGYSFLMKDNSRFKRFIYYNIEKTLANCRCTTISCSKGEHNETLKLTRQALFVNNAINAEKLKEQIDKITQKEHPLTVFTLGRICYQKNPNLFNRIAQEMLDVNFLWIGDGELRDELNSPNIKVTGWVKREDALERSMNADIFILTSLWEGLPISLLEAMYMKKMCVVSNVIGNRDVIRNEENGYVCENVDEFVSAIKGRKEEYIQTAYSDLISNYEIKVQAEKYVEIYKKRLESI